MSLNSFRFVTIAVLWIGYFILEGFDFGVGILLPVVAKNQASPSPLPTANSDQI